MSVNGFVFHFYIQSREVCVLKKNALVLTQCNCLLGAIILHTTETVWFLKAFVCTSFLCGHQNVSV